MGDFSDHLTSFDANENFCLLCFVMLMTFGESWSVSQLKFNKHTRMLSR